MTTLEDMIAPGKVVKRTRMVGKNIWYVTETGFEFPVDIFSPVWGRYGKLAPVETQAVVFNEEIALHLRLTSPEEGSTQ